MRRRTVGTQTLGVVEDDVVKLQQWVNWAEIIASLAIVATVVLLIQEVRGNTEAIERQAALDRATAINSPFFVNPQLSAVLVKIKAIDGSDPIPQAFVERYDLTPEEAILWERHLAHIWMGFEADYSLNGESQELEAAIRDLLTYPDNQVYWKHAISSGWHAGNTDFTEYVDHLRVDR
jgi:hypothetical protein